MTSEFIKKTKYVNIFKSEIDKLYAKPKRYHIHNVNVLFIMAKTNNI